ncbi:MAG TPA: tRNA epoxyqueuosine(34) reductase QueG [Candidatus Baltobacteraceae bacterium]|nr:tRNA epoxyqueuosine(34) reductase QueG [Candidatus Baltobacteraceae bacterium]
MPISKSSEGPPARDFVVRVALEAGASAVAIAPARPDERARERMANSFARGDFPTWNFDDAYAARAAAPEALLPGARSVICVAVAYATPSPAGRAPLSGRVSNYAWSTDYHGRVRGVLERIATALDARAGRPVTRIVCDTAPLAERAFAERAGLGWVGKHTNLIAPALGSYVFLGEILSTLELEPDAPLRKSCGNCARCVSACPTGALRGDNTIDAGRCISDLTQRTDGIPRALRPLVGDWVWGCDLCQAVCPPTRLASPRVDKAFAAGESTAAFPQLTALLELRSGEFKRRYARTGMGWRGSAILRRNAAVALGNSLDRSTAPALERALRADPHPQVRAHAAWALGRIGSPRALTALRARRSQESAEAVRAEIDHALAANETFRSSAALTSREQTKF